MTDLKIMTLNLKNGGSAEEFARRSPSILEMIRRYDPDLIGVQELMDFMIPGLSEVQESYTFFGKARGSSRANERCCVLFRKDRFTFLEGATFWLSDQPDVKGSKFGESIFPRIATYAVLNDSLSEKTLTFANTHLDHLLPPARTKQTNVLCRVLGETKKGDCLFLTGDFNSSILSAAVRRIADDPVLKVKDTVPNDAASTIRGFIQPSSSGYRPIDHVFVPDDLTVVKSEVIKDMFLGRYPSDHNPVITTVRFPDEN